MKPEQIIEARELMHKLDAVDREFEKLDKVMRVGDCHINIRLDSGKANEFQFTSCDMTKTGVNLISVMREILTYQKNSLLHRLKELGVEM